jgi:hypothetical protein
MAAVVMCPGWSQAFRSDAMTLKTKAAIIAVDRFDISFAFRLIEKAEMPGGTFGSILEV